jgi:hypothetical protein
LQKLLDRIAPLFDERGHDLLRFGVIERTPLFHLAIHQRRLRHTQRREPGLIFRLHRGRHRCGDIVD